MSRNRLISILPAIFFLATFSAEAKTHFAVWGDTEGFVRRPGEDATQINTIALQLVNRLKQKNEKDPFDFILSTGDIVRFDPIPKDPKDFLFFKNWPKSLLKNFYPVVGGDEELFHNKWSYYVQHVDDISGATPSESLRQKIMEAVSAEKDVGKEYYAVEKSGIHIIALWSPDNLDEITRTPHLGAHDIYDPKKGPKIPQYRWLVKTLWRIREIEKSQKPIVILSHRVVLNRAGKHLLALFDAFDVDLVFSGDAHVLAKKTYRGVQYVVTGMVGDELGLCQNVMRGFRGIRGNAFAFYVGKYDFCIPEISIRRSNKSLQFADDHYLDVNYDNGLFDIQMIRLEDGQPNPKYSFRHQIVRDSKQYGNRKRFLKEVE